MKLRHQQLKHTMQPLKTQEKLETKMKHAKNYKKNLKRRETQSIDTIDEKYTITISNHKQIIITTRTMNKLVVDKARRMRLNGENEVIMIEDALIP